jgi:dihydroflavonol-4-reductase
MNVKNKKVFITGASGKIGRYLVNELVNRGFKVIALGRNKSRINNSSVEVIEADILDIKKYEKQLRSCDYVFHLAAYQNIFDKKIDEFERVNIEGTKIIIKSISKSNIKKFFYISTTMVLGKVDMKNFYANTKSRALKYVKKSKIPWVVIYPSIVINLKDDYNNGWFWNLLTGGIPGGLMMRTGDKNRVVRFIWVDELILKMADLIAAGKVGMDYILDGKSMTADEYLKLMHQKMGKLYLPWRIPFI